MLDTVATCFKRISGSKAKGPVPPIPALFLPPRAPAHATLIKWILNRRVFRA